MAWVYICHNLYVVTVVCIKRVCDRLASDTLHITAMIHVATITVSDGPFMHAELCAEHVVVITAMIHVTALARLAHRSLPHRKALLDVGTQVPDLVAQLSTFVPVLIVPSSNQLDNHRL